MVTAACYARGTRILTERGDIAIEDLTTDDRVVTSANGTRPVVWLGHRAIDTTRHPDPASVWPVLVRQGAFGEGRPAHDLWLSPGHNVVAEGVLMPISALVNGRTILQVPRPHVEYWHVELDAHDIIFAEGLAAESYLDTGNRCAFSNGGSFIEQHPDFRPKHWSQTCLPLVTAGPEIARAQTQLLAEAGAQGHRLTEEAAPYVIADGKRLEPVWLNATRLAFVLPAGCTDVALHSRCFVPAQIFPGHGDQRRLGLCVARLQSDGAALDLADASMFAEGWHELEAASHRWTTGETKLPAGVRLVLIDLAAKGVYWDERPEGRLALVG